ncbi:branched-chain amino acid transporter [Alteribacter lacisalsi]|uniref:Branched-chain amino acid transporter n=1 Tax=Alteribacter lacisalsi TaxID=2045244 RepID=A0A2W0HUT6_9BACI|nr:AzlD domain-containing protein [Alteribacter lacisalsi]PYZ97428.1 branched-chain amino acid transporter [Alteribacter lacisalsi]
MSMTMVWMIVAMGLVTYIPRLLPLVMLNTENWPAWARRMLTRVPYAVLGALILPGILTVGDNVWFAVASGGTAAVLAYFGAPLIVVVGAAIGVLGVVQMVF